VSLKKTQSGRRQGQAAHEQEDEQGLVSRAIAAVTGYHARVGVAQPGENRHAMVSLQTRHGQSAAAQAGSRQAG